jgi:hypothetical protein
MRIFLTLGIFLAPTICWAARDRSYLSFGGTTFSTSTYVRLLLINPQGQRTGFLGPAGPQVEEDPNAGYTVDNTEDKDTGTLGPAGVDIGVDEVPAGQQRPAGEYRLTFFAVATTSYEGHIRAVHFDGSLSTTTFQGFLVQNSSRTYAVDFDPAPGGKFAVAKVVSFDTLREDLQTASQLGRVGEAGFVGHLTKLLSEGQKALAGKDRDRDRDRENKKEAVEKLREFIRELKEAPPPSVIETLREYAQDLGRAVLPGTEKKHQGKEDEEHEEGRRFVLPMALEALTGDAKALIQQLGGEPQDHDRRERDGR